MECFQTQNFWPLHGGALLLIRRCGQFVEQASQRVFFVVLTSFSLVVYGVRGAGYRKEIFGDDLDLFFHAVNRPVASGISKLDHFGLFDPYNGYLVVLLRAFTHIALIGPDTNFTLHAYLLMTVFFAVTTAGICMVVSASTSRKIALLAMGFLVFLPFSNLVILAQINTVAWPLALLMLVITATRKYPTTLIGKVLLAALFALTAMSTGTVVIAIAFLTLNLLQDFRRIDKYELSLLIVTAVSFLVQWFSYTPRTNPKLPLLGELHKALYNFAPQYIREKIGASLNGDDQIVFWIIPLMLLIIWLVQANFARQTNWLTVISATKLFGGGFVLLSLLIRGNGWFNTHYLYIPAAMFWISLVLLFHENRRIASTRMTIAITGALFATTYSGVFYLL